MLVAPMSYSDIQLYTTTIFDDIKQKPNTYPANFPSHFLTGSS